MENIKRPGFITSIVMQAWEIVWSIVWALIIASLVNGAFAFVAGILYNLLIAPVLGWAHAGYWFFWALFMLLWLGALWFRNYGKVQAS